MKEKTYVEDIDRSIYDVKDEERDAYKVDEGLTEAIVEQISREKRIRRGWNCSGFRRCRFTMRCRCRTGDRRLRGWI